MINSKVGNSYRLRSLKVLTRRKQSIKDSMTSENTISDKDKTSLPPRRVNARRRSKSRACASPGRGPLNTGLMTAAWPKTPTYRPAKLKTLDSGKGQQWTGRQKMPRLPDQVEEMEVDSHDNVMLSAGASAEFNALKSHASAGHKKTILGANETEQSSRSLKGESLGARSSKDIGRRLSEPLYGKNAPVMIKETRKSEPVGREVKQVTEKITDTLKAANSNRQSSSLSPVFIVLHVGQINVGMASRPASGPVKIYAERIMIQMEDEATKEDLSFRIMCKHIEELETSLENRPFFIKFKTSNVQYINQKKSKIKGAKSGVANETITLHLAYEKEVPSDVKTDLRELFKERLGDFELWKEVRPVPVRDVDANLLTEISQRSPEGKYTLREDKIQGVEDTEKDNRKRTPVTERDQKAEAQSNLNNKVARRILFQEESDYQERIKSLENEAAHYQLMLGHKRLEIQHLEQQLSKGEEDAFIARQEAQRELALRDHDIAQLQRHIDTLNLQMKLDKDTTNGQREQILELQRAIAEKTLAVEEQQQAIMVRDNQLKEVRAIATSPSRMNESELREQVKRLESSLRQTRTSLEETRRSKNGISEELRCTVDRLTSVREQLRSEMSRSRRLESESTAAAQQINDLVNLRRTLQIELTDERERITSLERERLSNHRRIDDEINRRVEIEAELRSIRSTIEEKNQVIEELSIERENAVIEIDILKREISTLNEQAVEGRTDTSVAQQPDKESHDWIIDREEVIVHNTVLGEGGWGQVKLGKFRGTNVAVKQIHQLILSPHNRRLFYREMDIASRCRHPCLLQFIGATCDDGIPLFVSELMETDLRSCLSQQPLEDTEALTIGLDVALALNYLHRHKPSPIIHRDISSANILIWYKGFEMHGKLSDYGAANFIRLSMTRHPGASLYSAPETAHGEQTTKIDIYSFGVLFCEMSIRELPVTQHREQQIALMKEPRQKNLVLRCIERNPASRPSAEEIIESLKRWRSE